MSALAAILELTEQVQSAIDGGDWPRARELEAERRAALERLASERSTGAELPSALAALYARNQRMIGEASRSTRRR